MRVTSVFRAVMVMVALVLAVRETGEEHGENDADHDHAERRRTASDVEAASRRRKPERRYEQYCCEQVRNVREIAEKVRGGKCRTAH